jgi:hypothetical protein
MSGIRKQTATATPPESSYGSIQYGMIHAAFGAEKAEKKTT